MPAAAAVDTSARDNNVRMLGFVMVVVLFVVAVLPAPGSQSGTDNDVGVRGNAPRLNKAQRQQEAQRWDTVTESYPLQLPTKSGLAYVPARGLCHPESGWTQFFEPNDFSRGIAAREKWETYGAWNALEEILTKSGTRGGADAQSKNTFEKFTMLGPVGPTCNGLTSFGTGDDEKKICALPTVDRPGCTIISLGCAGQWAYEEAIVKGTKHCKVHTYDCTGTWEVPDHLKHRVTFHKICIASKTQTIDGRRYLDYDGVLENSGLDKGHPPAHLKMDIEGWEYDVMRSIFMSTDVKMLPQQISLEIHWWTGGPFPYSGVISAGELSRFASAFYQAGYVFIDSRPNPNCPECIEVTLFRTFC